MRGSGRQAAAVPVIVASYYAVGLPIGGYLAFRKDMGVRARAAPPSCQREAQ
jgi:hypothetical protein